MSIRAPIILMCFALLAGCGDDAKSTATSTSDTSVAYDTSVSAQDATAVWDSANVSFDTTAGADAVAGDSWAPADTTVEPAPCPPVTGEFVPGDPLVIPTREGPVVGVLNDGVRSWLGIPFAAPPEGELRFAAPATPACRTSPLVASRFKSVCPQADSTGDMVGAEDCLTLNIWAPVDISAPLPVLVFIHGGAHLQGSASVYIAGGNPLYDGRFLAAKGPAVVVTIQYRLGALGWLAHPAFVAADGVALGNRGLLDQQQALRWLETHIAGFGGDPQRIMLFGESAGAVDVGLHLGLPESRARISGAIIQSGAPSAKALSAALLDGQRLVTAAGCADDTVSCLRSMDIGTLFKALPGELRLDEATLGGGGSTYGPIVDGALVTDTPTAMIAAAQAEDTRAIPVIIGTNSEEMASLLVLPVRDAAAYAEAIALYFATPLAALGGADKTTITARLLALYPVTAYNSPREAMVDVYTDFRFTCPAIEFARELETYSPASSVYRYLFARQTETRTGAKAAAHGTELPYVFGSWRNIPLYTPADADAALSDAMMTTWLNFAAFGRPMLPVAEGTTPTAWRLWTVESGQTLVWDAEITLELDEREARCDVWRELLAGLR